MPEPSSPEPVCGIRQHPPAEGSDQAVRPACYRCSLTGGVKRDLAGAIWIGEHPTTASRRCPRNPTIVYITAHPSLYLDTPLLLLGHTDYTCIPTVTTRPVARRHL